MMPSLWLSMHLEAQVPGPPIWGGPVACIENQDFINAIKEFMCVLISDYPLDGIIWDEPKGERVISNHPDTIAKYGENITEEQMEDSFVAFLSDLTQYCLGVRKDLVITIFNQAFSSHRFTRACTAIPGIQYAGYDGNLARQPTARQIVGGVLVKHGARRKPQVI